MVLLIADHDGVGDAAEAIQLDIEGIILPKLVLVADQPVRDGCQGLDDITMSEGCLVEVVQEFLMEMSPHRDGHEVLSIDASLPIGSRLGDGRILILLGLIGQVITLGCIAIAAGNPLLVGLIATLDRAGFGILKVLRLEPLFADLLDEDAMIARQFSNLGIGPVRSPARILQDTNDNRSPVLL